MFQEGWFETAIVTAHLFFFLVVGEQLRASHRPMRARGAPRGGAHDCDGGRFASAAGTGGGDATLQADGAQVRDAH